MKKLLKRLLAAAVLICTAAVAFADALNNKNAIGIYVIGSERPVGGIQYERRFTDLFSTKFGTYALVRNQSDYYNDTPIDFNFGYLRRRVCIRIIWFRFVIFLLRVIIINNPIVIISTSYVSALKTVNHKAMYVAIKRNH